MSRVQLQGWYDQWAKENHFLSLLQSLWPLLMAGKSWTNVRAGSSKPLDCQPIRKCASMRVWHYLNSQLNNETSRSTCNTFNPLCVNADFVAKDLMSVYEHRLAYSMQYQLSHSNIAALDALLTCTQKLVIQTYFHPLIFSLYHYLIRCVFHFQSKRPRKAVILHRSADWKAAEAHWR